MNLQQLQEFAEQFDATTCIMSVEKKKNGEYGKICIETGNEAYMQSFLRHPQSANEDVLPPRFTPGLEYDRYIPKDLNFEHFIYSAAVLKKPMHAYIHPDKYNVWFNIFSLPIVSDDPNKAYCTYTQELSKDVDASLFSNRSAKTISSVLQTCIKLKSDLPFQNTMDDIVSDIRKICDANHCCILLTNFKTRTYKMLSESVKDDSGQKSFNQYKDYPFIDFAEDWIRIIDGSNCLIIQNDQDMLLIKERSLRWYNSLNEANVKSLVLFPLKNKKEVLGFIWATNFNTENTDLIKDTLELATFFIASELANIQLLKRLEEMSENDLLTEVKNRNAMNNWVSAFIEGRTFPPKSIGIIFMDLNGLKTVNDNEGHQAGDRLLKNAASILKNIFAQCDIYRAGGDEFMIIALNIPKSQLENSIQKLNDPAYNPQKVLFAVGFFYSETECDIRDAMKKADALMYENKKRYYAMHPELKIR